MSIRSNAAHAQGPEGLHRGNRPLGGLLARWDDPPFVSNGANTVICTGATDGAMSGVEVLSGPERRRRWSAEQKRWIVAEAFARVGLRGPWPTHSFGWCYFGSRMPSTDSARIISSACICHIR